MGRFTPLTGDERLARIHQALTEAGIGALVLGGHAVRFYGVERTTIDYGMHLGLEPGHWEKLNEILGKALAHVGLTPREAQTWRPADFRRFILGHLTDGRKERLEFWRRNHLLAPFRELHGRRTEGSYGGRTVAFLGLKDLMRSKETEREDDWRDVELLEEIHDARLRQPPDGKPNAVARLSELRSRQGYEAVRVESLLSHGMVVAEAWKLTSHPITRAYLAPHLLGGAEPPRSVHGMLDEILCRRATTASEAAPETLAA